MGTSNSLMRGTKDSRLGNSHAPLHAAHFMSNYPRHFLTISEKNLGKQKQRNKETKIVIKKFI